MWRKLALGLLVVAGALNVAALALPFVDVTIGLTHETYSLLHTVQMLWQYGFQTLAVLVFGFSVVFPLVKLGILLAVAAGRLDQIWADRVGNLGKWSMLDLFLVILLLAVADGRMLLGAEPRPGLLCFTLGITLAMLAGEILHPAPARDGVQKRGLLSRCLLVTAGVGTILALILPLFAIETWFLRDQAYSIVTMVGHLWTAGALVPAITTALFLIATPLLRLGCLVAAARWGGAWAGRAAGVGRWSMLEPFALAVAIFVAEGGNQLPSTLTHGAPVLVATIMLVAGSATWLGRR
jgi:paraquat-inducible protein A